MLKIHDLVTGYGDAQVLHGIALSLSRGDTLAVLGRNGAGKSTLFKVIAGLLPAWSGESLLDQAPLDEAGPDHRARLGFGYVPEERRIFSTLTVDENLLAGAKPGPRGETDWTPERALSLFPEIARRRAALAGTLSGGERQMLAIARALVGNPHYLLLDEPSEGLAPVVMQRLVPVLRDLAADGIALLVAEQNRRVAAQLCDRAMIMETGDMVFEGSLADLERDPTLVTRYLGV